MRRDPRRSLVAQAPVVPLDHPTVGCGSDTPSPGPSGESDHTTVEGLGAGRRAHRTEVPLVVFRREVHAHEPIVVERELPDAGAATTAISPTATSCRLTASGG